MKKITLVLCAILAISCSSGETARSGGNQQPVEDPQPKVAILGVFHFDNPGLDEYKPTHHVDILTTQRQMELKNLLEKLEEFRPTKILIEANRKEVDSLINHQFQNYKNGQFDISARRNEIYQIGFKLAKKLGHSRIYASDADVSWCGADLDWESFDEQEYLDSLGQIEKSKLHDFQSVYRLNDSLKLTTTLLDHLKYLNTPENRLKDHQAYITNGIISGAGDNYLGADSRARWYRRNLRIFSNLFDIADLKKDERILMIYGSGHVWQLRQLIQDSPDFQYVEINTIL